MCANAIVGRLRLVGPFKMWVSIAKEPFKRELYSAKETSLFKESTNHSHLHEDVLRAIVNHTPAPKPDQENEVMLACVREESESVRNRILTHLHSSLHTRRSVDPRSTFAYRCNTLQHTTFAYRRHVVRPRLTHTHTHTHKHTHTHMHAHTYTHMYYTHAQD